MLAVRTPLWEAICFTQTGQRSGELTANSDQVSAQERLGAEVCVSSYFAAAKDALSSFAKSILPPIVAVFRLYLCSAQIKSIL